MTITLEIRPETEAEIARQAAAQGRPLEAVAADLLEGAVHPPAGAMRLERRTGKLLVEACAEIRGLFTDEEIDRMFARNRSTSRPVDLS